MEIYKLHKVEISWFDFPMCIKDPVDFQNVTKADREQPRNIFNSIQSKHKKSFEVRSSIKIKKENCYSEDLWKIMSAFLEGLETH